MGKMKLDGYPFQPPAIIMISKTGRFQPNIEICLSISNFHPENWNPMWNISCIVSGLINFMTGIDETYGSIEISNKQI